MGADSRVYLAACRQQHCLGMLHAGHSAMMTSWQRRWPVCSSLWQQPCLTMLPKPSTVGCLDSERAAVQLRLVWVCLLVGQHASGKFWWPLNQALDQKCSGSFHLDCRLAGGAHGFGRASSADDTGTQSEAEVQAAAGALLTSACGCISHSHTRLLIQYHPVLQVDCLTAAQLHVRAALIVALGRCMTWNDGSEAQAILRMARGTCLEDSLQAVQPVTLAFL